MQKKVMAEKLNIDKEAEILKKLGVEQYIIDYLMHQRYKEDISQRVARSDFK